jgi:hypothetical protein
MLGQILGSRAARFQFLMTNPNCTICLGIGWVCENHPKRAWRERRGCQCGAGMPCECVRADGLEEPDVGGVLSETLVIKH